MKGPISFTTGALWAYAQSLVARAVTSVGFLVIGLYIGPGEFGQFALVSAFLLFAEILCEQIWSQCVLQREDCSRSDLAAIFWLSLGLAVLVSGVIAGMAGQIARYYEAPQLRHLFFLAASCPPLMALCVVPSGILRRDLNYRVLTMRSLAAGFLSASTGIALVLLGYGATGLVCQFIVYWLVNVLVLWTKWDRTEFLSGGFNSARQILKLAYSNFMIKAADIFETRGVELIVAGYLGVSALGVYAFAMKIAQTVFQLSASPALEVIIGDSARQTSGEARFRTLLNGQLILAAVAMPALYGLALAGPALLDRVYGTRWESAALPLFLLAVGLIVRALLYSYGVALQACGFVSGAITWSIARIVLVVGSAALALHFGGGVEWVAVCYGWPALVIIFPSALLLAERLQLPLRPLFDLPVRMTAALLVSALLPLGLYLHGDWSVGLALHMVFAAATVAIYIVILVLLSSSRLRELELWQSLFGRLRFLLAGERK